MKAYTFQTMRREERKWEKQGRDPCDLFIRTHRGVHNLVAEGVIRAQRRMGTQLPLRTLMIWTMQTIDHHEKPLLRSLSARVKLAHSLATRPDLEDRQLANILESAMKPVEEICQLAVSWYLEKAAAAHAMCCELLDKATTNQTDRKPAEHAQRDDSEDDVCICCMDSPRETKYRPCLCTVCCTACAVALWKKTNTCPWCRAEVCEPGATAENVN